MKRRESLGLDLTPVIDVIFILLIFFIVTSVFKKEELALILDLPTSSAKEMKIDDEQIQLLIKNSNLTAEQKADIVHIHAIGPSIAIPFAKLLGLKVVVTHHGPDYDRKNWNFFAKLLVFCLLFFFNLAGLYSVFLICNWF